MRDILQIDVQGCHYIIPRTRLHPCKIGRWQPQIPAGIHLDHILRAGSTPQYGIKAPLKPYRSFLIRPTVTNCTGSQHTKRPLALTRFFNNQSTPVTSEIKQRETLDLIYLIKGNLFLQKNLPLLIVLRITESTQVSCVGAGRICLAHLCSHAMRQCIQIGKVIIL